MSTGDMEELMPATALGFVQIPPTARAPGRFPQLADGDTIEVVVRHPNGGSETICVPPTAMPMMAQLMQRLLSGNRVAVLEVDTELTPNEAAEILGMSRPLVVRRMDVGDLPFYYVGSHRRCKLSDVLALKAAEEERQKARDALAEDTEDLMGTYGLD